MTSLGCFVVVLCVVRVCILVCLCYWLCLVFAVVSFMVFARAFCLGTWLIGLVV